MQWLWDHEGTRYLDMFGGIVTVSVGHCHPYVHAIYSVSLIVAVSIGHCHLYVHVIYSGFF